MKLARPTMSVLHRVTVASMATCSAVGCSAPRSTSRPASPATTWPVPDVSAAIGRIRAGHDVPGIAGALVELDGPASVAVAGVRRVGGAPVRTDDPMHLGSCTKSMTALLIGQLVDAGQLRFDETMADCFPMLAGRMDPAFRAVTVRQLLDHRSGLLKDVAWPFVALGGGTPAEQRRRVAELVLCAKPSASAGEFVYSNVGYTLLGAIVDDRSGEPWETAIHTRLFKPLAMTTAGFGPPAGDAPQGHERLLGRLVPTPLDNPAVMNPAGRVHCSMGDWSRYVAFCLRASRGDTHLIRAATYRTLVMPADGSDYAGGWVTLERAWAGGRTLTHAGTNGAWFCVAWVAPKRGFAVLAATNCATPDAVKACDEVAALLIERRAERRP